MAVALITGASKGIGFAIAKEMAATGYDLVLCSRSQDDMDRVCADLSKEYGIKASGYAVDVSSTDSVVAFGAMVVAQHPKVEVLVNNAGTFIPGDILSEEKTSLPHMIETNLYSAYYLSQQVAPSMVSASKGHIFNVCSVASLKAYPGGGSYSISKFAMLGFSKGLREELKNSGVKVTSIMPGATWSDSWKGADFPEDRLMQASDIAKVVSSALALSASAVIEDIVIRPQLGDL